MGSMLSELSITTPYPFPTPADEFADKRVLVTGGTRGIGAEVVRRFQLAGAGVAATARSAPAQAVDGVPADVGPPRASRPLSVGWQPTGAGSAGLENHQEGQRLQGIGRLLW